MNVLMMAAACAMLVAGTAAAQDMPGPLAFAAAQAPEAGTGVCFDSDPAAAMQCAVDACVAESGLTPEDCTPQTVCTPAAWSADLFLQSSAGPHWHEYLCGWSTMDQLHAVIAVKCSGAGLIECSAVRTWNPDGEEIFADN